MILNRDPCNLLVSIQDQWYDKDYKMWGKLRRHGWGSRLRCNYQYGRKHIQAMLPNNLDLYDNPGKACRHAHRSGERTRD